MQVFDCVSSKLCYIHSIDRYFGGKKTDCNLFLIKLPTEKHLHLQELYSITLHPNFLCVLEIVYLEQAENIQNLYLPVKFY